MYMYFLSRILRKSVHRGIPVADPGGGGGPGGVQGVRTPLLGHDVGFLTLGPKLEPPFLLLDLRWTPVADPGCVCVWQG